MALYWSSRAFVPVRGVDETDERRGPVLATTGYCEPWVPSLTFRRVTRAVVDYGEQFTLRLRSKRYGLLVGATPSDFWRAWHVIGIDHSTSGKTGKAEATAIDALLPLVYPRAGIRSPQNPRAGVRSPYRQGYFEFRP